MTNKTKGKKKRRKLKKLKLPKFLKSTSQAEKSRKKRKLRIKKDVLILFAAVLLILCVSYIPFYRETNKLRDLGYADETIDVIRDKGLTETLLENQWYSAYLESCIMDDTLKEEFMELYTVMPDDAVLSAEDFLIIGRLMDRGYEQDQILNLIPQLYTWELTPLLVFDYQYNEVLYIEDCLNNRDVNSEKHFELAQDYYTHYNDPLPVDDQDSTSKLVNKTYYLDDDYVPDNLVELTGYYSAVGNQLTEEAAEALDKWGDAGASVNVTFYATSAYRSYDDQDSLYTVYKANMGQAEADSLSARAGFSEHQTGLTVDIAATNEDDKEEYKDTKAYQWTSTNSQDYGWILRYPEGKEQITGYQFESWHYRYLGVELAQAVYNSNMTYDEFYCLYLKPWDNAEYIPDEDVLGETYYTVNTEVTVQQSEETEADLH